MHVENAGVRNVLITGLTVIALSTFEERWGPLVFHVSGGIQPGRWRLVIELEESAPDIPFELELDG